MKSTTQTGVAHKVYPQNSHQIKSNVLSHGLKKMPFDQKLTSFKSITA